MIIYISWLYIYIIPIYTYIFVQAHVYTIHNRKWSPSLCVSYISFDFSDFYYSLDLFIYLLPNIFLFLYFFSFSYYYYSHMIWWCCCCCCSSFACGCPKLSPVPTVCCCCVACLRAGHAVRVRACVCVYVCVHIDVEADEVPKQRQLLHLNHVVRRAAQLAAPGSRRQKSPVSGKISIHFILLFVCLCISSRVRATTFSYTYIDRRNRIFREGNLNLKKEITRGGRGADVFDNSPCV